MHPYRTAIMRSGKAKNTSAFDMMNALCQSVLVGRLQMVTMRCFTKWYVRSVCDVSRNGLVQTSVNSQIYKAECEGALFLLL